MTDEEMLALTAAPPQRGMSDAEMLRATAPPQTDITDDQRAVVARTSTGRILDAAGEGAKHGWGARPLGLNEETKRALTGEHGNVVKDALTLPFRAFNGAVVIPAAAMLDGLLRSYMGGAGAIAGGTGQAAKEGGMPEADANRLTRDLFRVAEVSGLLAGAAPYVPHTRAARAVEAERAAPEPPPRAAPGEAPKPSLAELFAVDDEFRNSIPTPLIDRIMKGEPIEAVLQDAAKARPGEFAGNINMGRVVATDEVAAIYHETAGARAESAATHGHSIPEQRVITHAETEATARAMGITPEEALKMRLVEGRTAAENTALRQTLVESSANVAQLAKKARSGAEADVTAFLEAARFHGELFETVANRTAEAGRTLSAFRITVAEGGDKAKALAAAIKEFGGKKNVDDMIEAVGKLETPEEIAAFLAGAKRAGWKDMALEAWRAALLSGPVTQIRNIVGNSLHLAVTVPESAIAGALGAAGRATGVEGGVALGESVQRVFGLARAVPDAARMWWRAIKDENFGGAITQVEAVRPQAIPGVTGKVVRTPFRLLNAFDQMFKTLAFEAEVGAQALRTAKDAGLKGDALTARVAELIRNPDDILRAAGEKAALEATFQTPLTGFMGALDKARRSSVAAQFLVPFLRTPARIVDAALIERTPIGLLSQQVRSNLLGRNGAAARDQQLARLTMGSIIGYTVFQLAEQGLVSGSGPRDPNERAMMALAGRPANSVKIGDFWYEYTASDPFGMIIGLAADAHAVWNKIGTKDQDKIAGMIGMAISRQVLDKSFARGPSELIDAIQDPTRHGDRWIQSQASTLVPSVVRGAARADDPVMRDIRSVVDALRAAVPGLSQELPARRDLFGNEIRRPERTGPAMLDPVGVRRENDDPVVREMLRLKVYPAAPPREIDGVKLDPKQYERLSVLTGVAVRNILVPVVTGLMQSDAGRNPIPDFARQDVIKNAISAARRQGQAAFRLEHPEIVIEATRKRLERFSQ